MSCKECKKNKIEWNKISKGLYNGYCIYAMKLVLLEKEDDKEIYYNDGCNMT